MIGTVLLLLLAILLLVLLWPVTYRISFARWSLGIRISLLSGLWSKEIEFVGDEEISIEETPAHAPPKEKAVEETPVHMPSKEAAAERKAPSKIEKEKPLEIEDILKEAEEAAEEETAAPLAAEETLEEENEPSTWAQIRFAIHNGLAERVFIAASALLSHSFPKKWQVSGEFGTGDPMTTGVAGGLSAAFGGAVTEKIAWNYLEPVNTLQGRCDGRIIPIYVLYIAGRLLLAKPLWEFKKFRKGKHHG